MQQKVAGKNNAIQQWNTVYKKQLAGLSSSIIKGDKPSKARAAAGQAPPASLSALFWGANQTAKIQIANAWARTVSRELYRIDLTAVVSKYIGETEKNLDKIFAAAANHALILFFDEADALFGKRTDIKDAHDRYANDVVQMIVILSKKYRVPAVLAPVKKGLIPPKILTQFYSLVRFPVGNLPT